MASWYFRTIHSLTDIFFQFKFQLWFSGLLNHTIDSDIKSRTFNACKWPWLAKDKTFSQNFSLKINRLNQLMVREWIVRKYQLAIWLSIRNFYSDFTKVTRKCECFGCIVEPCLGDFKLTWLFGSCELLPSLGFRCCRWHRHLWSSVNFYILICFSQTTGPFGTKLGRNVTSWVVISIFMIFLSLGNPTCRKKHKLFRGSYEEHSYQVTFPLSQV
jgi:hypothetical protein